MSIITVTPAFARTKCRECQMGFDLGEQITTAPDGFRHLACQLSKPRENL